MNPVCPLCGGTRTQGLTTFTADLGFGVVVVRHVPQARSKHSIVDVTEWRDRAA